MTSDEQPQQANMAEPVVSEEAPSDEPVESVTVKGENATAAPEGGLAFLKSRIPALTVPRLSRPHLTVPHVDVHNNAYRLLIVVGLASVAAGAYYISDPVLISLMPLGFIIMVLGVLLEYRMMLEEQDAEIHHDGRGGISSWRLVDLEDRIGSLESKK